MERWYLLYCKRGEQERARHHLENQGVECFYPKIELEKMVRGKRKTVLEPLFPCYMFVYFDYEQGLSFTTVRSTRGVADFVRLGAMPKEVDEDLIAQMRLLDGQKSPLIADNLPKEGDVVRVKGGQFAGIDAIYQEQDGELRSIMLVKLISQSIPVSIRNQDLDLHS